MDTIKIPGIILDSIVLPLESKRHMDKDANILYRPHARPNTGQRIHGIVNFLGSYSAC